MWVTKLLISPVKIRIFCPRTTKFGPKLAFLFIFGQALPFLFYFWLYFGTELSNSFEIMEKAKKSHFSNYFPSSGEDPAASNY